MDVFHLQGMSPSVMVSGASLCRGLGGGGECELSCLGSLQNQEAGSQMWSPLYAY